MADSENHTSETAADNADAIALESSTYEIIQNRLQSRGKELQSRLSQLNERRKEVFGSIETRLLGSDRITTEHNCVPRDMLAVGNRFLFGYNVVMGLKTAVKINEGTYLLDCSRDLLSDGDLKGQISEDIFEQDFVNEAIPVLDLIEVME